MSIVLLVSFTQFAIFVSVILACMKIRAWYQERQAFKALKRLKYVFEAFETEADKQAERTLEDFEDFKANNPLYFVYRYPSPKTIEVYTDKGWIELTANSEEMPKIYPRKPDVYEDAPFCEMDGMQHVGKIDELEEMQETFIKLEKWIESNK